MNPEIDSRNGSFQSHMIEYIRKHFVDVLGEHAKLLDEEGGLERLAELIKDGTISY